MSKIPIYFVSGLAANAKVFEYISLPEEHFDLVFLDWILPTGLDETIQEYALRMCQKIPCKEPILVGVSFGGMMVQEMSKHIRCKKVIIISSIKNNRELPIRLKLAQITKVYKLFPLKIISNIEKYESYFFNDYLKRRVVLYKNYFSIRDQTYLKWAIFNVLHWQQNETLPYVTHIHGDHDEIFPIKNIKKAHIVKKGTHIMILDKAKTISKILKTECFY